MTPGQRLRAIVAAKKAIEKQTGQSYKTVDEMYEKYADKSVQIENALKE